MNAPEHRKEEQEPSRGQKFFTAMCISIVCAIILALLLSILGVVVKQMLIWLF
jgi:hypothetical protein